MKSTLTTFNTHTVVWNKEYYQKRCHEKPHTISFSWNALDNWNSLKLRYFTYVRWKKFCVNFHMISRSAKIKFFAPKFSFSAATLLIYAQIRLYLKADAYSCSYICNAAQETLIQLISLDSFGRKWTRLLVNKFRQWGELQMESKGSKNNLFLSFQSKSSLVVCLCVWCDV